MCTGLALCIEMRAAAACKKAPVAVDSRGQQKYSIYDARGPCQMIQSIMEPIFGQICSLWVAQVPTSPDLAIFELTKDRQAELIALSFEYTHGVIVMAGNLSEAVFVINRCSQLKLLSMNIDDSCYNACMTT